ncbi:MAG: GAF domain-containing protein [Thermodesulfobacteriota bacterium]|nr:GAF domain-containing protein [Thermodesulfobacteriota bacterium]
MPAEEKIDIDLFKVVFKAMAQSENLEIMANHLAQLLVATLEMKGCTIFVINPETEELEVLASFGLSISYVHKGPIIKKKSIGATIKGDPIVIRDINKTDLLQYPADARKEGIGAIVSIPIKFYDKVIGDLRLYHHDVWDIPERDVDSLSVLARNIGLAMTYTRMLKAVKKIRYTIDDLESLW